MSRTERTSILAIDLPEIANRSPYMVTNSHPLRTGIWAWIVTEGRRQSETPLVNRRLASLVFI